MNSTTRACALYLSIVTPLVAPAMYSSTSVDALPIHIRDWHRLTRIFNNETHQKYLLGYQNCSAPTVRNGLSWEHVDLLLVRALRLLNSYRYRSHIPGGDRRQAQDLHQMHPTSGSLCTRKWKMA